MNYIEKRQGVADFIGLKVPYQMPRSSRGVTGEGVFRGPRFLDGVFADISKAGREGVLDSGERHGLGGADKDHARRVATRAFTRSGDVAPDNGQALFDAGSREVHGERVPRNP